MVISTYYNKANKTMILTSAKVVTKHEIDGDVTRFFDGENNLVGMNIKNIESDLGPLVDVTKIELAKEILDATNPFIYATIQKIEKHPKSEKLSVCSVYDGTNTHQIVCGASNVEENKVVVMAKIGAVMPSGMIIKPAKVIDVDSSGMLCSFRELGVEIEATGIILKDDLTLVGQTYLGE